MDPHVRETVMGRADGGCELYLAERCTGVATQWHHRKMRSQGGEDTIPNGLAVCHQCHLKIHRNPAASYEFGFLVKSFHEPENIPVLLQTPHLGRRWYRLTGDGNLMLTASPLMHLDDEGDDL